MPETLHHSRTAENIVPTKSVKRKKKLKLSEVCQGMGVLV